MSTSRRHLLHGTIPCTLNWLNPELRKRKLADTVSRYTEEQMRSIQVAHRESKGWRDWIALVMVRMLRFGADTAMGYSHPTKEAKDKGSWGSYSKIKSWVGPSPMTERKWLIRCLFLESVAGVPGMVAGSMRHLHSLRRMKRDNGWCVGLRAHGTQHD